MLTLITTTIVRRQEAVCEARARRALREHLAACLTPPAPLPVRRVGVRPLRLVGRTAPDERHPKPAPG